MRIRTLSSVAALVAVASTALAAPVASAPPPRAATTYPGTTWEYAAPADLGFRPGRLDALAADARRAGSTCLLVARRGKVVGEWDWRGLDADQPREVFSVTKSVTSTLVGIAESDGSLSVDDRAARYVPQWRGTDAARVRIDNLLRNDSGRHWARDTDYGGLLAARNRSRFAVKLPQDHRPGRVWAYNNAAIQTLDPVLTAATGSTPADFAASRLFTRLGMAHTRMTTDPSGGTNTFFGVQSTCRDLARFGYLFLRQGRWADGPVVSKSWVRRAVGDSSQPHNAAYGRLWWVNRHGPLLGPLQTDAPGQAPPTTVGRLVPGAPPALFAALGLGGQVVLVDPASETVVVRLGELGHGREYGVADAARVITEALR